MRNAAPSPMWAIVAIADIGAALGWVKSSGGHPLWISVAPFVVPTLVVDALAAWRLACGRSSGWLLRALVIPAMVFSGAVTAIVAITKVTSFGPVAVGALIAFGGGTLAGWRVLRGGPKGAAANLCV